MKPITQSVDGLLDEQAAAQTLSVSVALLRKWRVFKTGPSYCKLGRLVRYRRTDLTGYIDANRVKGDA
ncbi:MAG TPA: hypothetical protein VGN17_01005 [Bryobacteraceae bacterium]